MGPNIAAAIDFGGTKTLAGLIDHTGSIIAIRRFHTDVTNTAERHFKKCVCMIEECLQETGYSKKDVSGVGVTLPGLTDREQGILIHAPHLGWRDVPVKKWLQSYWPEWSVIVANDVNACALGEMVFGKLSGYQNMLWVTISTGIGSGLIINGKMVEGEQGLAGELGHIIVEWDHPHHCGCGNKGCLEAHASGTAIAAAAQRHIFKNPMDPLAEYFYKNGLDVTAEQVARAAQDGIAEAAEIYRKTGVYLGKALSYAINLLNPGCVVIGGGVSLSWEYLEDTVKQTIRHSVIGEANKEVFLTVTSLGYEAAFKGAAGLVFTSERKV
jgi:glucokinase